MDLRAGVLTLTVNKGDSMLNVQVGDGGVSPEAIAAFAGAAATFLTGIAAVVAAARIGRRQVQIASRQVEIIGKQTQLQELSVREALFERRFKIYRKTQDMLASIFRAAEPPSNDEISDFWRATDQAQFLFRPEVHQEMVRILQALNTLAICGGRLRGEDALQSGPDRAAYSQMNETTMQYIRGLGDTLTKIFEPDLSIRA